MEILFFKNTEDKDLSIGLKICYKDQQGWYSKLGTITDTYEQDNTKLYIIDTSFGSYAANEVKLIK